MGSPQDSEKERHCGGLQAMETRSAVLRGMGDALGVKISSPRVRTAGCAASRVSSDSEAMVSKPYGVGELTPYANGECNQ